MCKFSYRDLEKNGGSNINAYRMFFVLQWAKPKIGHKTPIIMQLSFPHYSVVTFCTTKL